MVEITALARTVAETDAITEQLERAIYRLYRAMRRQPALKDMSPQDPVLLKQIARQPGITLGELATLERLRAPTITSHINRLTKSGLVLRTIDQNDRRRIGLSITPKGRRAIKLATTVRYAYLAEQLAALTEAEQIALAAAMPALTKLGDASEGANDALDTDL